MMQEDGITPGKITNDLYIDLYVKLGRIKEAEELFKSTFELEKHIRKNFLDLHGFSQGSAYIALKDFISSHWNGKPFKIISGKGLHSKSGKRYKMRDFIRQTIKKNFPALTCRIKPGNTGLIYVTKKTFEIETHDIKIPLGILDVQE